MQCSVSLVRSCFCSNKVHNLTIHQAPTVQPERARGAPLQSGAQSSTVRLYTIKERKVVAITAGEWLKFNNPFYSNIQISHHAYLQDTLSLPPTADDFNEINSNHLYHSVVMEASEDQRMESDDTIYAALHSHRRPQVKLHWLEGLPAS